MARHDRDATMLVLPADHVIRDAAGFQQAVREGVSLIDEDPSRVVTFGIRPTYAAESFGYLERGEPIGDKNAERSSPAYRVLRFREKPRVEVAQQYLDAGNFTGTRASSSGGRKRSSGAARPAAANDGPAGNDREDDGAP